MTQSQSMMGWQLNLKQEDYGITAALNYYINKYGLPPQILLEVSDKLEKVSLPDGMNIVKKAIRVPKNIIFIGALNETSQMGLEVSSGQE